ncbi:MAG: putative metal-binding motif-containing protein [Myxococcota bacterium]
MPPWTLLGATIVNVCPVMGPYCDTTSIEEALAEDPDYVILAAGTYEVQNLDIDVPHITIKSIDPGPAILRFPAQTNLDEPMVRILAEGVRINNIEFNGEAPSLDSYTEDARAIEVTRGATDVQLTNLTIRNFQTAFFGGSILVANGDVTVFDSVIEDGSAVEGGLVGVLGKNSSFAMFGGTLGRGQADQLGGALSNDGGDVILVDVTLHDNLSFFKAGHIFDQGGGSLIVRDSRFTNGGASLWAMIDSFGGGFVELDHVTFGAPTFASEGLVTVEDGRELIVHDIKMDNIGASGPGLVVRRTQVDIEESVFADGTDEATPAVIIDTPPSAAVRWSWFCGHSSIRGSLEFVGVCFDCQVVDSVFVGAQGNPGSTFVPLPFASALVADLGGEISVERNTFAANSFATSVNQGAILGLHAEDLYVERNLLFNNSSYEVADIEADGFTTIQQNASVEPSDGIEDDTSPINLDALPPMVFETEARVQPGACRDWGALLLEPSTVPVRFLNPPLGAFADDFDNDGYIAANDCDERESRVNPGAIEIPANGVDEDCDGLELCWIDADDDGFGARLQSFPDDFFCRRFGRANQGGDCDDNDPYVNPYAGTNEGPDCPDPKPEPEPKADIDGDGFEPPLDCDDTLPSVFPGADDPLGDDVDQNCDGVDGIDKDGDGIPVPEDCHDTDANRTRCDSFIGGVERVCATGAPAPLPAALALLLALPMLRRRSP